MFLGVSIQKGTFWPIRIGTNYEHEMHFHLISRYEMVMVETANRLGDIQCHYCEGWPVQHAWRACLGLEQGLRLENEILNPNISK